MADIHHATTEPAADLTERVRAIRARLPGQVLTERVEVARVTYAWILGEITGVGLFAVIAQWDV